ncbi:hypothetical protein CVT26_004153 [Gymnopilus dilepis]|uniref:CUE domain-containing protein n=1 Tax=Gymnopilus dilepis TaxID=231916 RepID=A0A409W731_9AGAR|nr:hypothetical protein CVT26_004153 [Gymnopilus dilepis]
MAVAQTTSALAAAGAPPFAVHLPQILCAIMGEVVNVLVAFAVIVFLFRWATSSKESSEQRSAADALGFRPKNVTQEMSTIMNLRWFSGQFLSEQATDSSLPYVQVDTISNMFPDIPADNIRYDLLRTGNVELTTNKILERGFLDAPPAAYHTLYPRTPAPATNAAAPGAARATTTGVPKKPKENLISRYGLQDRLQTAESIKEEELGGKAAWEDTPEKREASLKERKAKMILAARQRLLAQQQKEAEKAKSD